MDEEKRGNILTKTYYKSNSFLPKISKQKMTEILSLFGIETCEVCLIKMLFFVCIESVLSDEFEILFWEDEVFESFFEINSVLTSLSKEEIFISIIHNNALDIFTCHTRIESKKSTLSPAIVDEWLYDFHTYSSDENIVIHGEFFEILPELFMTQTLESTELTHITDKGNSFSPILLCQTDKHLDTCHNRLKSSIIGSINNETFIDSLEDIPSCMWEMNMAKIRDDIKWGYPRFTSDKKRPNQYARMMFSEYW